MSEVRCAGCGDPAALTCHHCNKGICGREALLFRDACPVCGKRWFVEVVTTALCDECGAEIEVTHGCGGAA